MSQHLNYLKTVVLLRFLVTALNWLTVGKYGAVDY